MKSLSSLLTVSLMLATGTVLAHDPVKGTTPPAATPQGMDHSKMDMSGKKSAEHQKMAAAQFAQLDANKDGSLSKAEFAKHHAMMGMQHGQMDSSKMDTQKGQMDHSKMGMSGMNAADHQKMAMAQFAKLDSNSDGKLSKAEFAKHHAMMGMQSGRRDHGKMGMSGMNPTDHQKMAMDEFAKLDTNKDGKLARAEIAAGHPLAAHFDMLDTNKDGSLSKAEFAKHHGM